MESRSIKLDAAPTIRWINADYHNGYAPLLSSMYFQLPTSRVGDVYSGRRSNCAKLEDHDSLN